MGEELETFLSEQRDRQQIHDVLMAYCRGVDRGVGELIAASFWPDASIDTGIVTSSGKDFAARVLEHMADPNRGGSMHLVGNESVELNGDLAFCETYMLSHMVVQLHGADHLRVRGSRYIDRWERRDGEWRVARRVVVDDWTQVDTVKHSDSAPGGMHSGQRGLTDHVFRVRDEIFGTSSQA
jgi:SnoaL-like domain